MGQYRRSPVIALGLPFLVGALFTVLLQWGSFDFEASWPDIGARLSFRPGTPPPVAPAVGRAPAAGGFVLPAFRPDPAFPYTIWALASQEGELVRTMVQHLEREGLPVFAGEGPHEEGVGQSLLIGRFTTRQEADVALEKLQWLDGLKRIELIQTGSPRTRQED
jgi:hypothetical protein